jgi:hypothetical protein
MSFRSRDWLSRRLSYNASALFQSKMHEFTNCISILQILKGFQLSIPPILKCEVEDRPDVTISRAIINEMPNSDSIAPDLQI